MHLAMVGRGGGRLAGIGGSTRCRPTLPYLPPPCLTLPYRSQPAAMASAPEAKRQKTNGFGHCSRRTSAEDDEVRAGWLDECWVAMCHVFHNVDHAPSACHREWLWRAYGGRRKAAIWVHCEHWNVLCIRGVSKMRNQAMTEL